MTPSSEQRPDLTAAVERADPDELVRIIDGLCAAGDWDGITELRDRCRHAVERGKQLWGVAEHAVYRLALEAPGQWAGPEVVAGAAPFALGPLPEVAAQGHDWEELAPHIPPGPARAITAHERVLRGENLTGDETITAGVLEIPLRLEPWEPRYPLAEYRSNRAEFPSPPPPPLEEVTLPAPGERVDDPTVTEALLGLVKPWIEESNGRAQAAAVQGTAPAALAALGVRRARLASISAAEALAAMAWSAASGGAHGRRRGAAPGRFGAWWAAAALADLLDEWPLDGDVLGAAVAGMRWYAWSDLVPPTGWTLYLAAEDPPRGRAWAVAAVDAA